MVMGMNNLFGIMLVCLLAIAPLGRVVADSHYLQVSQAQNASPTLGMDHSGGHHSHPDSMTHDCAECPPSHDCDGADCSCTQCTSHFSFLLPVLAGFGLDPLSLSLPSGSPLIDSQHPSPPDRPPCS